MSVAAALIDFMAGVVVGALALAWLLLATIARLPDGTEDSMGPP